MVLVLLVDGSLFRSPESGRFHAQDDRAALRSQEAVPSSAPPPQITDPDPTATIVDEISPQSRSAEVLNNSSNLFDLMQSLASSAFEGDADSQLTIARALFICVNALPFPIDKLPGGFLPDDVIERVQRDAARCRKMQSAGSNNPLALAIKASTDVLVLKADPDRDCRETSRLATDSIETGTSAQFKGP